MSRAASARPPLAGVALLVPMAVLAASCSEANSRYRHVSLGDGGPTDGTMDRAGGDSGDSRTDEGRLPGGPDDAARTDAATASDAGLDARIAHLVGYWKFDEPMGSPTAADSSGRGNHGLLEQLDPQTAWVLGRRGGALEISGADHEAGVRVMPSASIDGIQRFTLAAWAYRTAGLSSYASVVSRQILDSTYEVYNLSFTTDVVSIYLPASSTPGSWPYIARSTRKSVIQQWMHLAATFDGNLVRLYLDGVEEAVMAYPRPLPATTTPLYLGNNKNPSDGEPMVGKIDDLLLFSEALSASEIAQLAAGVLPAGL